MNTHAAVARRRGATVIVLTLAAAVVLMIGNVAGSAIVATVPLGTSANYAVLASSTVTNTGNSTLAGSLGLWPGTSITGFPPGLVLAPGTTDTTNAAAQQAQSALTAAYVNAAGRPIDATTTADLANLNLTPGVYAGPSKSALMLNGPLILNGQGNTDAVFIFQTNSTLVTGSSSTVTLINGAQGCNVFWQVGSSATLGSSSVFTGNILAQASITVNNSVTVHGRALARTGAVTLDDDTFVKPTCAQATPVTTTTTTTTTPGTPTTVAGGGTGTGGPGGTGTGGNGTPGSPGDTGGSGSSGVPGVSGAPRTGATPLPSDAFPWPVAVLAGVLAAGAAVDTVVRRRARRHHAPVAGG